MSLFIFFSFENAGQDFRKKNCGIGLCLFAGWKSSYIEMKELGPHLLILPCYICVSVPSENLNFYEFM